MRYSIRKVWNSPAERKCMDSVLRATDKVWRRGRGPRNSYRDWQSIPQSRAAYLTYYITTPAPAPERSMFDGADAYYEFVGIDTNSGKPRIKPI